MSDSALKRIAKRWSFVHLNLIMSSFPTFNFFSCLIASEKYEVNDDDEEYEKHKLQF